MKRLNMQGSQQWKVFLLVVCVIAFASPAFGQAVYGSIYGTVTDPTGAAVPDATITITDEAKGTSVTATSNGSGGYSIEHLIPDSYDVKVAATGFKAFEATGVRVFADTSPKVDATMTPGGSTETVEVRADSIPELKTDRADVSTVFTNKEVVDLPIGDRNFTNLQLLLPGAQKLGWAHAADENPQGSQQIQVDGQAFGGVAFELDGTDNQDPILGIIVINPNLDSVSETKITTQNFDAEFGKAVASVVTAQTKSGSNSFHGSAFDYRISAANLARDPFTQGPGANFPAGLKNQFGGSVGGPILKDKLFFFGDYQGVRQKVGTSVLVTVPSALLVSTCLGQRVGPSGIAGCDFSEYAALVTPAGTGIIYQQDGTPYKGNVIPANQVSDQAKALLTLLQPFAPNAAGKYNGGGPLGLQNNYAKGGTGLFNSNEWDERVDFTATEKIHVFERFSRFTSVLTGNQIFGAAGGPGFGLGNFGGNSTGANDSAAAGTDIAINPTLITDIRLGYYRYNVIDTKRDQTTQFATQLGIPGLNTGTFFTGGAPAFNLTDVGSTGGPSNPDGGGLQFGDGLHVSRCNCPLTEREDQFQLVNNWTKTLGNHLVKVGADLRYARNLRVPSDNNRTGILNFSTFSTSNPSIPSPAPQGGLSLAALVLGNVTDFNRYVSVSTNAKEFQKRDFFYAQDTWRVTPKLTVNYGLRYEFYFPEAVNGARNGSLLNLKTGYLSVAGVGSVPSDLGANTASNAYNPRIGVAYSVTPRTVIRSGYGRSFDIGVFGSIFGHVVTQNLPVLVNQQINHTGGPLSSAFSLSTGPVAPAPTPVPGSGLLPNPGSQVSSKARPFNLRLPTLDAWNLSIQQSLTPTLSFTIAYVGNKGTHTLSAGDGNNTNPNESAIFLPAQYSITGQTLHFDPNVKSSTPGVVNGIAPNGGTANQTLLQRYYGGTLAACQDPNYVTPNLPGVTPGRCGWTNSIGFYGNDQDTHFNALQVTVAKQFSRGASFTANYAWQRGVNFKNDFSTWSRPAVKGRDDSIREQQIVIYGLYELPFGRNKPFLSHANGLVNEIVGGWQISPVINYSGGLPFNLSFGECGNDIPGDAPCYVNGNPHTLPIHLTGFPGNSLQYYDKQTLGGNFTDPGLDQIGNSGRNSVFGPHFFNTDLSLQKNFPIKESIVAQFRVDAFNAFNHINFGNPNGNIEQVGTITSGPGINGSTNPRQMQFTFRIEF